MPKKVLITGAAGFIGFHLTRRLLEEGCEVVGLDNLNSYYDPQLKLARLKELGITKVKEEVFVSSKRFKDYRFIKMCLSKKKSLEMLFQKEGVDIVCHLGAEVGVRQSCGREQDYINSNIIGFTNLLEVCKLAKVSKCLYASSSSVEGQECLQKGVEYDASYPVSFYGATKKCNELLAYVYAHSFGIQMIGMRFFTVYGPWGRPDMALFSFTQKILANELITLYNKGELERDFTYVTDVVDVIKSIIFKELQEAFYVFNIGNTHPRKVRELLRLLEKGLGKKAWVRYEKKPLSDMHKTHADIKQLHEHFTLRPTVSLEEGIKAFLTWYQTYYKEQLCKVS